VPPRNASIEAITVRLPVGLARTAKRLAARRGVSLNELVRMALREMAEDDRIETLRQGYDALASDADSDVEPYLAAQREIVRRG
jgi:hypothetical protein